MSRTRRAAPPAGQLPKCPTGIHGLDQITRGGLPQGRPTLVCGGAGSGKTLLGMEFLVRGAREYGENGVFVSFEERPADLDANTRSLGFAIQELVARRKLIVDQVQIDRSEILETGEYNLDGLFLRLGAAIDAVHAKRVVLDTIEVLFGALSNLGILRSELRRLFAWLRDRGVTTVVTGERGEGSLTRHGLEEYVSDCVILLDQRVTDQIATRRLRIVKYRGALHGTHEYPFLIEDRGFVVLPIADIALEYAAPTGVVPTGVASLDALFRGGGFFRGSTVMVSGGTGTGKSSLPAHFVDAGCRRGERCLYFAFEESAAQIERNMRSLGLDLGKWSKRGLLHIHATRPAPFGLEMHISTMLRRIDELKPRLVVFDPVTSFDSAGTPLDAHAMLIRLIDLLKARQITAFLISLTAGGAPAEQTSVDVSSLIDSWILLRSLEQNGERTRGLQILKSRGMQHSNQIRELLITDRGVRLEEVIVGPQGVLVGAARAAQLAEDRIAATAAHEEIARRRDELAQKNKALQARIAELQAAHAAETHAIEQAIAQEGARQGLRLSTRRLLAAGREGNGHRAPAPRQRRGAAMSARKPVAPAKAAARARPARSREGDLRLSDTARTRVGPLRRPDPTAA